MKTKLLLSLLLGLLAGTGFQAAAQSMADQAMAGKSQQGEIQVSAKALVTELDGMIDEYQRNGLKGDDINNLKNLHGILIRMSDKDMAKILALLDQAGTQNDPASALKVIAAAYTQQKGVLVQMKQILASYASDEEAQELSKAASDLADRQAANLQAGIESAQWAVNSHDDAALAASLQAQTAEQKSLNDEMQLLQTKIANFAKDPNNAALAARFNQGVQDSAKVTPLLGAAADSLSQNKLFEAVTNEKTARDQMRQLARTIAPPQDDADALQAAIDQLEKIISQQKDVITTTSDSIALPIAGFVGNDLKSPHNRLAQVIKKNNWYNLNADQLAAQTEVQHIYAEYKRTRINNADGLENLEGDLANQSDALSQDIAKLAKPAADALTASIPPMQGARSALTDKDAVGATKPENDALADMEAALAALQQQLAAAQKADGAAGDEVANLEELQKQTQALMQNQAAVDNATAQPKTPQQNAAVAAAQNTLEQKAQQLQQQTAAAAPAASQSLANAAGNMSQAAGAMSSPSSPAAGSPSSPAAGSPSSPSSPQGGQAQAQAQQAQAMQNLANANAQLGQQIQGAQQAQQQLADAQKYMEEVEKLIEAEQKMQSDTKQTEPQQKKEQAQIQALAPGQQTIQGETNDLQKALAADATLPDADAMAALASSASAHMGAAHGQLATGDAASADPQEGKALDDLYALKNSLQAQIQADQNQLNATADADAAAAQSTADAAAAVAQAQAEAAQAQSAMSAAAASQSAPQAAAADQQAAGDMNQAAQAVGNADAQAAALPAGAQQAMQAAAADAAAAAAAAAAGQNAQAQAAGQQAQAALGQASAALAQAQAGIADAGAPGTPDAGGPPDGGPPSPGSGPPGSGPPGSGPPGSGPPGSGPPGPPGPPGPGTGPPGPGTGDGQGNTQITNGAQDVSGRLAGSRAQFLGLPPQVRAAIQQSQSEKYPQQYAAKVEQYLENLANDSSAQQ